MGLNKKGRGQGGFICSYQPLNPYGTGVAFSGAFFLSFAPLASKLAIEKEWTCLYLLQILSLAVVFVFELKLFLNVKKKRRKVIFWSSKQTYGSIEERELVDVHTII